MPIFEVIGSSDPLGLWDTHPQAVSFGAGGENTPEAIEPIYRVNLSDDLEISNTALAENLANFEHMKTALEKVPFQLNSLVRRVQEKQLKAGSGIPFDLAGIQPEAAPEEELLSLLAIADLVALGGTGPEGISFGFLSEASAVLGVARVKFDFLLEQVNHEILHLAWVEMKMADQLIARTKMGWSASHTFWINTISTEQMSLHKQTLKVVSLTRHLKLRLLLTVAVGAVKVAPMMVTPSATGLAVPAVYGYVKKILDNVKELRSIKLE